MKGLYQEIEKSLDIIIDGLNYDFLEGQSVLDIDPEKMKSLAKAKISSLSGAKKIINKWVDSPNRPSDDKLKDVIERVVSAGDSSIKVLRTALEAKIDYSKLEAHKHEAAISSKPVLLESILEIDSELKELREKLKTGDLTLVEREFDLGYPEKFAKGEFFPLKDYYKNPITEEGSVIIDPKGSKGKRFTTHDLEIVLPRVPKDKTKILFHDLPKEKQFWTRQKEPKITLGNIEEYHDYIVEEYRRRREGIWFYNNGVPTYLTGNHYWALQWCKMLDDGDYPKYREVQRDMFYFMEACIVDRRCLGMILLKSRRTGFTYSALDIELNMATSRPNGKFGMMSKSGTDGQEMFDKISYMFLSLPFWLRPVVRGKVDSPKELFFGQPSDNSKETKKSKKNNISDYLNTSLDWRNTLNGSYDSIKLNFYVFDECGKIVAPNDAIVHLGMITPTMMPNGRVVGKMFAGSTMGGHEKGGGNNFISLINGSKVGDRDPKTQKTATGLYFYFIPAQDNMEEFTDIYGKCWKEKPPKGTKNVLGAEIKIGSDEYLDAIEAQKMKQGEKAYNEQKRTYPRCVADAMRDETGGCLFNAEKLNEQLEYNRTLPEESLYMTGNFNWKDGIKDSDVVFDQDSKGRFKVSWLPSKVDDTEHLQNRVKVVNGKFFPLNGDVLKFGCDPFSLASTHGEGSKGGLHGLTLKFPAGGAPSNKFVVEYIARPSDEVIFFEDVIKCIKFYGAPILVESNRIDLLRHMYNRGYRGFAINRLDRHESQLNEHELKYGGQTMSGKDILDSHLNSVGHWIENYVGVYKDEERRVREVGEMGDMPFNETLSQWLKYNDKERTKFDGFISSGLAIMACNASKYKGPEIKKKRIGVRDFFPTYNNKGDISEYIKTR